MKLKFLRKGGIEQIGYYDKRKFSLDEIMDVYFIWRLYFSVLRDETETIKHTGLFLFRSRNNSF